MSAVIQSAPRAPLLRVDVHEPGIKARSRRLSCKIGEQVDFNTEALASYCFAQWEPLVFDALLIAAAVEFCDRAQKRAMHHWARRFELRLPVHDPSHWVSGAVSGTLLEALRFLTGDDWQIDFVARRKVQAPPMQSSFVLPSGSHTIIPFSDGMDSRAVAGLETHTLGQSLLRVRLGSKMSDLDSLARYGQAFASVPYSVQAGAKTFAESSARSRGFKFATISGLTAYLSKAERIIVPESGQGALGPALVPVGQAYQDYRNHPLFTDRMEAYFAALLNYRPRFEFPRLWHTKGETLKAFVNDCPDGSAWEQTWSCWQSARQASVDGHKRQCGICAACLLRRMSVHAAGLTESKKVYVWEDLTVASFEKGAAKGFARQTAALREYAIAGVLHLDHLAALRSTSAGADALKLCAFQLSRSSKLPETEVAHKLARLLTQHELEWRTFMQSLGTHSFIAHWAAHAQ
jgi:7-cyano-7-deazaguanine synthase in queuosine biosynthesis